LRAATDREVAERPGSSLIGSHWNFDDSIGALRKAVDGMDDLVDGADGGDEPSSAWESKVSDVEQEDFEADAAGLRYRHRPDHPAYTSDDASQDGGDTGLPGIPSPLREDGQERAAWEAGMQKSASGEYEVSEDSIMEILARNADAETGDEEGGPEALVGA